MKKSIVAILAVAIIGALGIYSKSSQGSADTSTSALGQSTTATATTPANSQSNNGNSSGSGTYKDGTYNGASEDTPYGTVQIATVINGGKITEIKFLQMPGPEGHSRELTAFAEPYLKQETLRKQNGQIDFVSGATTTSEAYEQSLQAALDQAA